MWFGLVIVFIDHLNTHDSWLHFTDHWHTQASVLSLLQSPLAVAWQRLQTADVNLTLGSRTIPVPRLPASKCNSSQRLNCSSLTNSQVGGHLTPTSSSSLDTHTHTHTHYITHSKYHCYYSTHKVFTVFTSRFLVTDFNTVLCLRPYRLAHIPQLN
jgi:hypothetical protein